MNALSKTDLAVQILPFEERYASDFARLNYEWLNQYFEVEPHDREMLDAPKAYIIERGGHIFFARYGEEIVGTVALIVEDEASFELAKMGVDTRYRGLSIGKKLIEHTIAFARTTDKSKLVLESNTKLAPALNLYIKSGFKVITPNENSPYTRCNIRMELSL
ncbi:GNAT family N-acetyltransferase [Marinoscillum furvescens]|uniref:Acetyltransferase (GNAT) family protein n=1 Tax=Marinoscillum furvescens DSM 4134 TaxID=1122208 RepID=A0A3D9L2D7_MARFU|nr:GNAT family N-acetyltransferase [Marinoscillum furvescens]RED96605.1 acetyltransferase (GNAT) family protein [Marinoscillum furvescens DSM 4134]